MEFLIWDSKLYNNVKRNCTHIFQNIGENYFLGVRISEYLPDICSIRVVGKSLVAWGTEMKSDRLTEPHSFASLRYVSRMVKDYSFHTEKSKIDFCRKHLVFGSI